MKSRIISISLLLLHNCVTIFAQGLLIKGNDSFIDERSSYHVFNNIEPVFKERLTIDFEMAPVNMNVSSRIGYILRIKNAEARTTYNILYNDQGRATVFKLNHEGKDVLITAVLDREELYENHWVKVRVDFDMCKDSIHWEINGRRFSAGGLSLDDTWKPAIFFGRSEHVIDIPSFALRNLTVGNDEKEYYFPLNENEGEQVHDMRGKVIGQVTNPVWLINKAYYWEEGTSFTSKSVAGSNFNQETQEVVYFNRDSITIYNVRTKSSQTYGYRNECPISMRLGTNFIDRENRLLYVYEVSNPPSGNVMVAALSLDTYEWDAKSTEILPRQLHHHSNYLDKANRRYIIFGGFGNQYYSNNFYSYNIDSSYWEKLSFDGDKITPRYFSSMGELWGGGVARDIRIQFIFLEEWAMNRATSR